VFLAFVLLLTWAQTRLLDRRRDEEVS
jgi:hypothetical protein